MNDTKEIQELKQQIANLHKENQRLKHFADIQSHTAGQLKLIVEMSKTGTWEWNVQTGETTFNDIWAKMLGYSLQELMPTTIETWTKLTHPDDLEAAQTALENYFNKETTFYEAKFRMLHRNGNWVWVLDRGQVAEWTTDGKPLLMLGTHQVIDAIKETEIALQKEEGRLESLLKINQYHANSVQELLDYVLDEAIALTNSKLGYIYFYNEEKKEFTLNTWSKEVMQQCHVVDPQTIYKLEKTGIWGEAVRQRKPVVLNNFNEPNPLKKGLPSGHAPLQKFLTLPIFDQGEIVAVVGVANKPDDYDNSDIRQLTLMMDSVWKIVQRKKTEQKLEKANRLYAVISQVNQAIVHIKNEEMLLKEICSIAIDYGLFKIAWIGLLQGNEIQNYMLSGDEKVFTAIVGKNSKKRPSICKAALENIKLGNNYVCNSIDRAPCNTINKQSAHKYGYRSSIFLPLKVFGKINGFLAIYSEQEGYFDNEEVKLLDEVMFDVGFGLEVLENSKQREEAMNALGESEKKFRNLVNQMQLGLAVHEMLFDDDGNAVDYRFVDVNPAFECFTGLKADKTIGKTLLELLPQVEKNWIERYGEVVKTGRPMSFEDYSRELKRHYSVLAYRPQPGYFAVLTNDITERVEAEKNLKYHMHFQKMVADISSDFIRVNDANIDNLIQSMLERLGHFFEVDRSYMFFFGDNYKIINNTHEWCSKGTKSVMKSMLHFEADKIPWWKNQILNRQAISIPDIGKLPKEAAVEKEIFRQQEVKSLLSVPVIAHEGIIGFFGFDTVKRKINWDKHQVEFLKVIANILADAHVKVESEAKLKESEAQHRLMFETAQEGIVIAQDFKLVYFNPKICEFTGYDDEELQNIEFIKIIHPDDQEMLLERYKQRLRGEGVEHQYEFRLLAKDGSVRWVTMSGVQLIWNGRPATFNFLNDITRQKETLEKLAQREEKYRLITENASDVIWVLNINSKKFTYISPAVMQLRGYTVEEALAQSLEESVIPESLYRVQKALEANLNKFISNTLEDEYHIDEIQQPCKNGEIIWVEVSTKFRFNKKGEIEVVGVSRNVEERKKMENELKNNSVRLRELNATKDKFFSIISHDLRSPFSTLVGFTELMSDEQSRFSVDEYRQYARAIHKTAQSTFNLLENLLEWSRIQQGTAQFKPEVIELKPFMHQFVESMLPIASNKKIDLNVEVPANIGLKADKNMLNFILRNLVSNAIKFTREGGSVSVNFSKTETDEVLFTVKDTGIGIDAVRLQKLFIIDENVSRPGTNGEASTGLGLILCKEFVDKHGGKIWAESDPGEKLGGQGSTFYFTLGK